MNFFIPGGAGYIGVHISSMLLEHGHDVVILDNFSNSNLSAIASLENLTGKEIALYIGSICDEAILKEIFTQNSFDAVIHLAALKSVSESILRPNAYFNNNCIGTSCLLAVMRSFGMKNLIYSSSATVYGIPQYLPIDENHPLSAINPYAETKLQIEQELSTISQEEEDWNIVCLRYFNPVGAHQSGLIGENPQGIPNNVMPLIVNAANKEISHLNIYGDDYETIDGTGVRDYIHVMDLAKSHLLALNFIGIETLINHDTSNQRSDSKSFHIFNVGTGKGFSVLELINTFEAINNVKVPYQFALKRPGDVASCYANVDHCSQAFQWTASKSMEEMCSSAWKFKIKENE
jgi:UDP-glucose 4-epimerase